MELDVVSANHLARVLVTPNQQGTQEKKDEVISGVGAQDRDTSGYQVSADLDNVEFYWENGQLQLDAHAVFRPDIDTPFSPTAFDDWEMGGTAVNPILLDEADVDSYFYRNIFYMSQSKHQIVRMSRGSNRTSIAIKLFQFLRFKDPATIYPSRRSDYLQKRTQYFGR